MNLPIWLVVALLLLAVARGTRLITEDVILEPLRGPLIERAPNGKIATLITCPWCVSIWVGFAGAALVYFWADTWPVQIGLLALSASWAAGMLALIIGALEQAATD